MPGPGGGANGGGFYGGADSPAFNFDTLVDLYVDFTYTVSNLWTVLNKPLYYMISDVVSSDESGIIGDIFESVVDFFALSDIDTFLNKFTLLELFIGAGLLYFIGIRLLRSFFL
ncbi:MAG: hypothetical protein IJX97_00545 [Clostridia bacterium]|nr:hypothetical protein [Clostridia bacterium]